MYMNIHAQSDNDNAFSPVYSKLDMMSAHLINNAMVILAIMLNGSVRPNFKNSMTTDQHTNLTAGDDSSNQISQRSFRHLLHNHPSYPHGNTTTTHHKHNHHLHSPILRTPTRLTHTRKIPHPASISPSPKGMNLKHPP
jgi:hypothetical protein